MLRCFLAAAVSAVLLTAMPLLAAAQIAPGELVITVVDAATKAPLENAEVFLVGPVQTTALTPKAGLLRFEEAPAGLYRIKVQLRGYQPATLTDVEVPDGRRVTVRVSLVATRAQRDRPRPGAQQRVGVEPGRQRELRGAAHQRLAQRRAGPARGRQRQPERQQRRRLDHDLAARDGRVADRRQRRRRAAHRRVARRGAARARQRSVQRRERRLQRQRVVDRGSGELSHARTDETVDHENIARPTARTIVHRTSPPSPAASVS